MYIGKKLQRIEKDGGKFVRRDDIKGQYPGLTKRVERDDPPGPEIFKRIRKLGTTNY
jgi:hypothetical protein